MKILVVNLLRAGDILMTSSVLGGLKGKFPGCEVHLLINKQFRGIVPILPSVDVIQYFDRNQFQMGIGEYSRPIFEPLDRLNKLTNRLNAHNYDLVVNLTQNRLSGKICALVHAPNKLGLVLSENRAPQFGSPWFSYLNYKEDPLLFHMNDIFCHGLELEVQSLSFNETLEGDLEAKSLVAKGVSYICVQLYTSDSKKDYGESNYFEALKTFSLLNSNCEILLLGAPNEREKLEKFDLLCRQNGMKTKVAICSFAGAFSLLKKANALLTGDTSIKHLACGTNAKILELSLGSSNFRKTGPYVEGAYIVDSRVGCHPCAHREDCYKSEHICSLAIDPRAVGLILSKIVCRQESQLHKIAEEYSDQFSLYKTGLSTESGWQAISLSDNDLERMLEDRLLNSTWRLYNFCEHTKQVGSFGTESRRILGEILRDFPRVKSQNIVKLLNKFASRLTSPLPRSLPHRDIKMSENLVEMQTLSRERNKFKRDVETYEISQKLVRSLKTNLMEKK